MSQAHPTRRLLAAGEVHVWRADLDVHRDRSDMLEFLCTSAERRRAGDMQDDERRARYVARKGLLRLLLGDYAQRMGGEELILSSSAYCQGAALFALARTSRLGAGLAPVRPGAMPPPGLIGADEALWIANAPDRARAVATFVAVREAAGRALHDLCAGSLASALMALGDGMEPVPLGDAELCMQIVRFETAMGCIVHDGSLQPAPIRALGA